MIVPNSFPKHPPLSSRIAFIGEAPGAMEDQLGIPFSGPSGKLLRDRVSKHIPSEQCFFGNICQIRPPGNDIDEFKWHGTEIQSGLAQLKKDLSDFKPNVVCLLGKTALYAALTRNDISNLRGSMFICNDINSPFFGFKCIPTYHPAACLRMYEWVPIFSFDIQRTVEEGSTPHLSLPQRDIQICRTISDVETYLTKVTNEGFKCGTDIEGYVFDMQCIGIAYHPNKAFVIPFRGPNGDSYWSIDDEIKVWKLLAPYLENPSLEKVWQNGLYDRFVIQHSYHIVCRGNTDDTMLQWHEKYCELPKGLDMQTSLLTREPYYKHERKSDSWETKLIYCGKDACVTLEIHNQLTKKLDARSQTHYLFNRDILNPLLYMELRGISYAYEKAQLRRRSILHDLYNEQHQLDQLTGFGHKYNTGNEVLSCIREVMCFKRGTPLSADTLHLYAKKDYKETIQTAIQMARRFDRLSESEKGQLSTILEKHCNVNSTKFQDILYRKLNLPVQINKKTKQPTADYPALCKLSKKTDSKIITLAIGLRDKSTHTSMLSIRPDIDGRIRCGYNAVGTNTGRLTCYESPTGSGYNLQTIPKKDRDLFLADEGFHFFQCDLSGADGWTIGAHTKNLGDPTMLDDFYAKLKPAKILTLMLRKGAGVSTWDRERLYEESKAISGDDQDYFMCKCLIWGMCYLLGTNAAIDLVFKESEGKLIMSSKEMEDFRRLVFIRYWGILQWHEYTARCLKRTPVIAAASGLTRRFFGRRDEILGEALAFEPQANTTYATNMAVLKLWGDSENRTNPVGEKSIQDVYRLPQAAHTNTRLRIEPLHQVHDALCGQFQKTDTSWAIGKIKQYFDNPFIIAGQTITIPFAGEYGPSWGELGEKHGGGFI